MSCKTRVGRRNERLQRLDEWQTGRFKRNRRQPRAEMGDVQDDSSPAAMRALAPIPVELCKPTRAVPPAPPSLPPASNCQLPAQSRQASRQAKSSREREEPQAGGRAGRAEQSRGKEGQAQKSRRGGILEQASSSSRGKASSRDGTCHHCDLATWTRVHLVARLSAVY